MTPSSKRIHPRFARAKKLLVEPSVEPVVKNKGISDISVGSHADKFHVHAVSKYTVPYRQKGIDKEGNSTGRILCIVFADENARIKAVAFNQDADKFTGLILEEQVSIFENICNNIRYCNYFKELFIPYCYLRPT